MESKIINLFNKKEECMARRLWVVIISLCFVGVLTLRTYAQQTAPSSNPKGQGAGSAIRQEMQTLRQQAEQIRSQLQQLEAQARPLREQLRSIHEKMKADREKLESLRVEHREQWQQHQGQGQQQQASAPTEH
jgi:uncharacterized coiled-coil DUF342 family protein